MSLTNALSSQPVVWKFSCRPGAVVLNRRVPSFPILWVAKKETPVQAPDNNEQDMFFKESSLNYLSFFDDPHVASSHRQRDTLQALHSVGTLCTALQALRWSARWRLSLLPGHGHWRSGCSCCRGPATNSVTASVKATFGSLSGSVQLSATGSVTAVCNICLSQPLSAGVRSHLKSNNPNLVSGEQ